MIGILEGEHGEKGEESIFEEITAYNFSNLRKEKNIQVQEAQRVPKRDETREAHTKAYRN